MRSRIAIAGIPGPFVHIAEPDRDLLVGSYETLFYVPRRYRAAVDLISLEARDPRQERPPLVLFDAAEPDGAAAHVVAHVPGGRGPVAVELARPRQLGAHPLIAVPTTDRIAVPRLLLVLSGLFPSLPNTESGYLS